MNFFMLYFQANGSPPHAFIHSWITLITVFYTVFHSTFINNLFPHEYILQFYNIRQYSIWLFQLYNNAIFLTYADYLLLPNNLLIAVGSLEL